MHTTPVNKRQAAPASSYQAVEREVRFIHGGERRRTRGEREESMEEKSLVTTVRLFFVQESLERLSDFQGDLDFEEEIA